jgi:hypothetical protein
MKIGVDQFIGSKKNSSRETHSGPHAVIQTRPLYPNDHRFLQRPLIHPQLQHNEAERKAHGEGNKGINVSLVLFR